jgi:hypothetical protein
MRIFIIITFFSTSLYSQIKPNELSISGNLNIFIGKKLIQTKTPIELILINNETSIDSSEYSLQSLSIVKNYKTITTPTYYYTKTDSLGFYEFNSLKKGTYKLGLNKYANLSDISLEEFDVRLDSVSVKNFNLTGTIDCEINDVVAALHIKENKPKLILVSGISPIIYSTDNKFEKKFKVKYSEFGCLSPSKECVIQYNKTIFEYLDKKYGGKWRKEVRKDVIGLK